jgi:carboxylate-amine ligase
VDPSTLQPRDGASLLLPNGDTSLLKQELFQCIVEITTPVLCSALDVAEALEGGRIRAAAAASAHGLRILASGAYPLAVDGRPRVTETPRYRDIAARLGDRLYGQLVCGLHIHVGLGAKPRALNALEGIIPWLPAVLAVSANSAIGRGHEASVLSVRSLRLAELDASLLPPVDADTKSGGAAPEWWDARFNERWQTLEVRVPDQPTDVNRSGSIAALIQALAVMASQTTNSPADRTTYERRRQAAASGRADVRELARHVEPMARRLGTWGPIRALLESRTEGERQLRFRETRGRRALLRALLDRSVPADATRN